MRTAFKKTSRGIISMMVLSLVVQPFTAYAAATDLADIPLIVQSRAKPNVLFTLDNSGSMAWGTITGSDATGEYNSNKDRRAFYSPTYNQLYYNPNITYLPAVKYDDTAPNFTSSQGASPAAAAKIDPYVANSGTVDLTQSCWSQSLTLPTYDPGNFRPRTNNCLNADPGGYTQYARYAFYYQWNGNAGAEDGSANQNSVSTNYTRKEIISGVSYTKGPNNNRTDCGVGTTSCTYAQEIQNFANWFTYYRSRILTAKSSLGLAFSVLDSKSRVGFSTINNNDGDENINAANFVALQDFDKAQKQAWYSQVYSINPGGGTPLVGALDRAGKYYQSGAMQGGPGTARETTVPLSCTPNFTILSTDGYWNGNRPAVGRYDTTVPTTLPANIYTDPTTGQETINDPIAGAPLRKGQAFPAPFYDSSNAQNTLADVAMKYWITDLGGTTGGKVAPSGIDPATWQHMATFTIGLGASGTLKDPPTAAGGNWPAPVADQATAIDDLWHAALNGHGQYFNAKDPAKLQTALASILNDIVNRSGASAAVGVTNPNVTPAENSSFNASFNSGTWYGDLQAFAIDVTNGTLTEPAIWSAQELLDKKDFTTRLIASFDGATGVPFTTTGLTSKLTRLNSPATTPPGPTGDNAAIISYLRGDRAKEGNDIASEKPYRKRTHLLGDIVNAESTYISAPRASYTDPGYLDFKNSTVKDRTKVVYQGANDGMLHAFNTATGNEMWAYVPGSLLDMNLSKTLTATSSLVGLTQQPPTFQHRFYVDGTAVATDVDFNNTSEKRPASPPSPNWQTVLVGGLGKGGRGFYALNVTDPTATTEAAVANKVMWEFPNASTPADVKKNIGYSYATPLNVKTKAAGWVTLVSSGYNNGDDTSGDGRGHLYVLDTLTGRLLKDLSTTAGTAAAPAGLSKISAFLVSPGQDDSADYAYGGDMLGNVWRFDLSAESITNWNVKLLATLVDANGNVQPVTAPPELGVVNSKRMVFVGTGAYLGASDIPGTPESNPAASRTQSLYGLYDDQSADPTIATPLRNQLVQQTARLVGDEVLVSSTPVQLPQKKGWVLDFPSVGERSYTSPVLFQGVLTFTTNIPSSDPCTPGGTSFLYFLNYANGGAIPNLANRSVGNVLSSRPQPIALPDGSVKVLVRTSDGKTRTFGVNVPSTTTPTRIMWREVISN